MTSKEIIEALNYIWFYEPTSQEEQDKRDTIIKELKQDLEEYERLKELMGTPIQELMNKLKELEKVKSFVLNYTAFYENGCCLDEYIYYDSEIGTLFKKWNEE